MVKFYWKGKIILHLISKEDYDDFKSKKDFLMKFEKSSDPDCNKKINFNIFLINLQKQFFDNAKELFEAFEKLGSGKNNHDYRNIALNDEIIDFLQDPYNNTIQFHFLDQKLRDEFLDKFRKQNYFQESYLYHFIPIIMFPVYPINIFETYFQRRRYFYYSVNLLKKFHLLNSIDFETNSTPVIPHCVNCGSLKHASDSHNCPCPLVHRKVKIKKRTRK